MRLALVAALAALLPAVAAAQNAAIPPTYARSWEGGSAYGNYLAGRAALALGQPEAAADYLFRASAEAPEAQDLTERAFSSAILAGDVSRAAAVAARGGLKAPGAADLGGLVRAVEALATGKGRDAVALLATDAAAPIQPVQRLLRPVAAAAAGDWKAALAPTLSTGNRLLDALARLVRADLLEMRGRFDEASAEHDALAAALPDTPYLMLARAAFLERRGRGAEAVAIYDAGLRMAPEDLDLKAMRARAAEGRDRPPAPTLASTSANLLASAGGAAFSERQPELAVTFMRLSLRLDPSQGQNGVLLGDILGMLGQTRIARDVWRRVPEVARQRPDAELRLALSLAQEEPEEALRLARSAAARSGNSRAGLAVAELLNSQDKYAEAIDVLRGRPQETEPRWWFLLGAALERSGRWAEAEPVLSKALSYSPDDPEVLNYVGYAWIDRGTKVKEGLALVEKAVAAAPKSGAIRDSLAWAHYRMGDYEKAVEILELAVKLEPGNPEIVDHLGDAYWRTDRKVEAGYQWRRVLTLAPPAAMKAAVETKLKTGLADGAKPL